MRKNNYEIEEWRSTEWNIEEEHGAITAIGRIFDWKSYFYDQLPDTPEKQEALASLESTINNIKWKERLEKRGIALFLIVSQWAKYVKATAVKENIFWQDVPGYNFILKAILLEMKER